MAEAIERYRREVLPRKDPVTQQSYDGHLRWWRRRLGAMPLADLRSSELLVHRDRLARHKSPATMNRYLASHRPGDMGTQAPGSLRIYRCPVCKANREPIELYDIPDPQFCPACGEEVYPSDCLRLWEEVSEHQSNVMVLSRFMLLVEHMLPVHYIRYLFEHSLDTLGALAFFVDGPLAVFGTGAWMHYSTMRMLEEINEWLLDSGRSRVLIIGLQKSGQVVDHAALINRYIQPGHLFAIDDEYRYRYILSGPEVAGNGFGSETLLRAGFYL